MSAFLNPHLLWGLLLVAAPIIIHLLNKRRFEVHGWAAMDFLLQADVRNRRRIRIEDLLLLLLRAAVVAAAVFLVARPMVEGLGGRDEAERLIIIDDSFSMEHRASGPSALERAREAAVFEVQEAIASRRRVSVRRGTRPWEEVGSIGGPVKGGASLGPAAGGAKAKEGPEAGSVEASSGLISALRSFQASDGSLRLAEALDAEAERMEKGRTGEVHGIYLASDFRRKDWIEGGKLLPRLDDAFRRLKAASGGQVRLRFANVGESRKENCAVARVAPDAAQPVAGMSVTIVVEARNFGSEERRGLAGELEIGDPANPTHRIPLPTFPPIPPGGSASVEVEHAFAASGEYPLIARIDEDRLSRDDRAFAVAVVRSALSVLVVDGDPGTDRFSGEAGFLAAALAPRGAVSTGIRPEVVREVPGAEDLKARDAVFLLNVPELSEKDRDSLEGFVRSGGGVAFFLGNKVRPERYREVLGDGGIFPASLRSPLEGPKGSRIDFGGMEHPTLSAYRGMRDASVERIAAARYFDLAAGPGAQVIAAFTDGPRTPAVLERALGQGSAAVFNLSADRDWTDWPTDPSYPVLLQEWARHLAPRRGEARSIRVGEPYAWPAGDVLEVQVADPRGTKRPALVTGGLARLERAELAGLYQILQESEPPEREGSGEGGRKWFAVNRPIDESDLTPASEGELRSALAAVGIPIAFSDAETAAGDDRREGDIWRWLALTAGLFLLGELGLAYWVGRR